LLPARKLAGPVAGSVGHTKPGKQGTCSRAPIPR
jgi:hypothetical protein